MVEYKERYICYNKNCLNSKSRKENRFQSHAIDLGSIPGSGRSPGKGNGKPLQYSFLENAMDRGLYISKQVVVILAHALPVSVRTGQIMLQ